MGRDTCTPTSQQIAKGWGTLGVHHPVGGTHAEYVIYVDNGMSFSLKKQGNCRFNNADEL